MLVIGLGHKAQNGKDTFAGYLQSELIDKGYTAGVYSLGKELKYEVNEVIRLYGDNGTGKVSRAGWNQVWAQLDAELHLPEWVKPDYDPDMTDPLSPYGKQRLLLQWWGTEYRREQSPNYWVLKLNKTLKEDNPDIAIITDIRFPNEFAWVSSFERDGITVRVTRVGYEGIAEGAHSSETALEGYPFDVDIKAGTLEELKNDAVGFAEFIINRNKLPEDFKDFRA